MPTERQPTPPLDIAKDAANESRWLLLIHQLPPKPAYLRVKIWRRLQRLGAVAIKNSVYALPASDQATEDFQWILREIVEGGGDASICEARFVDGLSDAQVEALFHAAREADYAQIAEETRSLSLRLSGPPEHEHPAQGETDIRRLRQRFTDVVAIDFCGAPGREAADGLLCALEARLRPSAPTAAGAAQAGRHAERVRGRTWVTRKGIHVDRMASAWLIRRFIDADARFKFVPGKGYRPAPGELRFDMFDAEFTHDGDRCTFEVLLERFGLDDPALRALAEIVHDIDLKDSKFERPETAGLASLVLGTAMAYADDEARLARASATLEDLYEYFRRKGSARAEPARARKEHA